MKYMFFFGRPLSSLYGLAMKMREKLYSQGLFQRHCLSVPVISVGNLVLGGTGKTPTVCHLTKLLLQLGYHPAIISRGYGGKAKQKVNVVSDGQTIILTPEQAGDEPYMLAESLPGIPVLTGTRRIYPCRRAVKDYNADVLILDDGFQHLAIMRDLDLVLFDGTVLSGNNRIFPGGILREPFSALNRCDAFIITGITTNNKDKANQFGDFLKSRFTKKPVFSSSLGSFKIRCSDNHDVGSSEDGPFFAFCGIANPSRFQDSLSTLSLRQSGFLALPDHVHYTQAMMTDICRQAIASGAQQLITTQKDFVKIRNFDSPLPRYVVEINIQTSDDFDFFVSNSMQRFFKDSHLQTPL